MALMYSRSDVDFSKIDGLDEGARVDLADVGEDEEDDSDSAEDGRARDAVFSAHLEVMVVGWSSIRLKLCGGKGGREKNVGYKER